MIRFSRKVCIFGLICIFNTCLRWSTVIGQQQEEPLSTSSSNSKPPLGPPRNDPPKDKEEQQEDSSLSKDDHQSVDYTGRVTSSAHKDDEKPASLREQDSVRGKDNEGAGRGHYVEREVDDQQRQHSTIDNHADQPVDDVYLIDSDGEAEKLLHQGHLDTEDPDHDEDDHDDDDDDLSPFDSDLSRQKAYWNRETVKHQEKAEPSAPSKAVPPPKTAKVEKPPRPLTETEKKAEILYQDAYSILNKSLGRNLASMKKAYRLLDEATALNHTRAQELVGFAYLFGDYLPWNPRKARQIFEQLSLKGSPRGQIGLGFIYSAGILTNSSQAKALIYFTFAALGGDSWAQMALGYRYSSGISLAQNCESALTYYRKVAEKVASEVQFIGGPAIQRIRLPDEIENPNSQSAQALMDDNLLQYYKFLADKGDVQAQVGLGQLYMTGGRGVEQNHQYAYHYFTMAAEANNANANAYLGKMFLDGTPATIADNATAYQYFKRAAEKGNPIGQSGLGIMYLYGRGVERDYDKAYQYFSNAAEQGWVDGQLNLGHMYFNGIGLKRDYKMASRYFQLASQSGHVLAFYNLAQMHSTGIGMVRNCLTAVELYKNVAERGKWSEMIMDAHILYRSGYVDQAALKYYFLAELGYEVAQSNVAYMLDKGDVRFFDKSDVYPRALLHLQRSANQGYGWSRVKVGDYYYYGHGTPTDYETAVANYKTASELQHNAQAMFNLGYMYEQGLGTKKDIHLAKRFYDMASETSADAQVPVSLALMKLGLLFTFQYLNEKTSFHTAQFEAIFGQQWDLYAMTGLLGFIILLIFVRRHR